jgi:two-component system response regulator (stage 0 sporulation protein A)
MRMIMMPNDKAQVLIVDDCADLTGILCDYINLFNHTKIEVIGVASNGFEAIEMITSKQPEIVILDIIMPHLDGIGVLKRIHAMNMEKKPLFIMLTAVGENKVIEEALSLDAVYYIEKPFDMDILVSKIIQLKSSMISNMDYSDSKSGTKISK